MATEIACFFIIYLININNILKYFFNKSFKFYFHDYSYIILYADYTHIGIMYSKYIIFYYTCLHQNQNQI